MALAHEFLDDDGVFGGVIPISLLRGRESAKVRDFVFSKWTPLYILKPTFNYGFSEWSEYRDVLFIAKKGAPPKNHRVKFAIVKKDLTAITHEDVQYISQQLRSLSQFRGENVDIETFSLQELRERFANLMWFCGVTDYRHRDTLVGFVEKFSGSLNKFPDRYFREGYRPVPKGVSSFLFLTRNLDSSRIEQAFLHFENDDANQIDAKSPLDVSYEIEKEALTRTLRTGVGIKTLNIQGKWDYIAKYPYKSLQRVVRAGKFRGAGNFDWERFWNNAGNELERVASRLVVVHRINPYSSNTYLASFVSQDSFSPSNQLNVVNEDDPARAQAQCVLFNSALFFAQFFLLKEETTGRYINIRFYDLDEMELYPGNSTVPALVNVFKGLGELEFPPLREQLDQNFDQRYEEFWTKRRTGQISLFNILDEPVEPAPVRLEFDRQVCEALGVSVSEKELRDMYEVIVKEMIITRGLRRD